MWAFHTLQDIPVSEVYTKPGKKGSSFVFSTYFSKCCLPDNNILLWKCQNKIFQCSEEGFFFFSRHECCKSDGLDPWKPLLCRTKKWFVRVALFFFPLLPFFLSLGNTNLHLCKPEKVRPMGLCWQVPGASKRRMGAGVSDGTRLFLSAQVSKGPLFQGCRISKAIKLRNSTDFPHS